MPEQEITSAGIKKQQEDELISKQEQEEKEKLSAKERSEKLSDLSDSITQKYTAPQIQNPVLASQAEKLQIKIAKLTDKNTALTGKIEKNNSKIEQLRAKIKDRTAAKAYYKELLATTALPKPLQTFIQARYDRQDEKIKTLTEKIDAKLDKNKNIVSKIEKNNQKIAKQQQKLKRLEKTDKFLTNLTTREGRRENFVEGLQELREWSLDRNKTKSLKLDSKIDKKEMALTKVVSAAEKVKLRNQLTKLYDKKAVVDEKIVKLTAMTEKLTKIKFLPSEQQQQLSAAAAQKVQEAIENSKNTSPDKVSETVLDTADKSIDDFYTNSVNEKTNEPKQQNEQNTQQPDSKESTENNGKNNQAEKAFDIAVLCSAIVSTFEKNFNPENKMLNTNAVLTELAKKFNFDDVKSAIAVAILDRPKDVNEGKISMESRKWAWDQPLTDNIKPFNKALGLLPLDIKSGFLDVFAKKVGAWEQNIHSKDNSVLSRKDITKSAAKIHEHQQQKPQEKNTQHKKNQSL